jgi:hypothetical protein
MADMRRKIELLQELAADSRPCAAAILELLVSAAVEQSQAGGGASPAYSPPASPEYCPPAGDLPGGAFSCGCCGRLFHYEVEQDGRYEVWEHLETEHGMEDAEEEELNKLCRAAGDSILLENMEKQGKKDEMDKPGKQGQDGQEKPDEEKLDEQEKPEEQEKPDEQKPDEQEKLDEQEKQDDQEKKGKQDREPEASSATPDTSVLDLSAGSEHTFNVENMEELKAALARDGDFKFTASEALTETEEYRAYMQEYEGDPGAGAQ